MIIAARAVGDSSNSLTVFVSHSRAAARLLEDRKSTRLNSSHLVISYAVFCLKKKKTDRELRHRRHHVRNAHRETAAERAEQPDHALMAENEDRMYVVGRGLRAREGNRDTCPD